MREHEIPGKDMVECSRGPREENALQSSGFEKGVQEHNSLLSMVEMSSHWFLMRQYMEQGKRPVVDVSREVKRRLRVERVMSDNISSHFHALENLVTIKIF